MSKCVSRDKNGIQCFNQTIEGHKHCFQHRNQKIQHKTSISQPLRGGFIQNSKNVQILTRKQEKILADTYQYYVSNFKLLTDREYELVKPYMDLANESITLGDVSKAVYYLTNVYVMARQQNYIPQDVRYPGPHDFSNLSDFITQEVTDTYTI